MSVALTAMVVATAAGAATIAVSATKLATATIVAPVFVPLTLSTTNNGPKVGRADKNDTTTITYSQPVNQPTLCSGWSNASNGETLTGVTLVLNDNVGTTGNDTLTVGAVPPTCATGFRFGTIDTGSNAYTTGGTASFTNSTIDLLQTPTSTTVVFTFGNPGGAGIRGIVTTGTAAIYSPDATLQDAIGRNIGLNQTAATTTIQW
jgi:hypothetical protein